MKEAKFREIHKDMTFPFNIYYALDEEENVVIDEESMKVEFDGVLKELMEETK